MSGDDNPLLRAAADRMAFLEFGGSGGAGVSDLVVASWERCRVAGVDVVLPRSSYSADFDPDSLLLRCAGPAIEQLAADIADLPVAMGLADKRVRVVRRVDGTPEAGREVDRVEFAPGFDFSESTMGTNAVGTVVEAGQPVSLIGLEHFSERLQRFAAAGAPVIDPVTGRIEGVVTIAALVRDWNPLARTLARNTAAEIGRNLLLDRSQSQRAVFDAYLHATARSSRLAVFAFGTTLWIASPAAEQLFDPREQQVLRDHADFLLAHRDQMADTLVLPGGQRLVHLRGTRILVGTEVAGKVVIAEPATSRPLAVPGVTFRAGAALAVGHSPAWVRACTELREAVATQRPTLLLGETGAGKFTLLTELLTAVHPGANSLDVDARTAAVPPSAAGAPTVHIVRGIDGVSEDEVDRLGGYLATVAARDDEWVVATASHAPATTDLPFRRLLDHFDTAITVPPLRTRTDDLPGIAAALLAEIAPGRKLALSPAAQRLLLRYTWPRNIAELREALDHAVSRRPLGEIQDVDLPGYCQTTSRRTLTPLEGIERDAIVAALRQAGGNRAAAATQLGMSRSSLYRKLKTYGITT